MNEKVEEKDGKKIAKNDVKSLKNSQGKASEKSQNVNDTSTPGSSAAAGRNSSNTKHMNLMSPSGNGRRITSDRVSKSPEKAEFRIASRNAGSKEGSRSKGRDDSRGGRDRPPRRDGGRAHHSVNQSPKAGSSSLSSPRGGVDGRKVSGAGAWADNT